MLPTPTIKARPVDAKREKEAVSAGLDPVVAKILAARPFLESISPEAFLVPKLAQLDHPKHLADIDKAVARLCAAIENNEVIGLETDHDCDGQTSHAVLYCALVSIFNYPKSKIRTYIGHRLEEGYGLSEGLSQRILEDEIRPQLIITADNGSTDEAQIARLKEEGIEVIVTDHHEIPKEGVPKSAVAVLNPTREECAYPDRAIAGCMVAWLFMAAARSQLMAKGLLPEKTPNLAQLLDFVAVGTIADCVSLSRSYNNRAVVQYGLKLIQSSDRPCWRAVRKWIGGEIRAEEIAFRVGPLLNADGRLDDALSSVSFLLTDNDEQAEKWIEYLIEQNKTRKGIQDKMTSASIPIALERVEQKNLSICIYLESGHPGVHGISASRIKELFGRPTIIFSPKYQSEDLITGSARGVDGTFHLREALQWVADEVPGLLIKFGGHKGAAGLTIKKENFELFREKFEQAVRLQIDEKQIGPVIWTDGVLPVDYFSVAQVLKLNCLEPFGREFEAPVFEVEGQVMGITWMGQEQIHARVRLKVEFKLMEAIWFRARTAETEPSPIEIGEVVKVAFSPRINEFRGESKFNPQILAVEKIHGSL